MMLIHQTDGNRLKNRQMICGLTGHRLKQISNRAEAERMKGSSISFLRSIAQFLIKNRRITEIHKAAESVKERQWWAGSPQFAKRPPSSTNARQRLAPRARALRTESLTPKPRLCLTQAPADISTTQGFGRNAAGRLSLH